MRADKTVAKPKSQEGTRAAAAGGKPRFRSGTPARRGNRCGQHLGKARVHLQEVGLNAERKGHRGGDELSLDISFYRRLPLHVYQALTASFTGSAHAAHAKHRETAGSWTPAGPSTWNQSKPVVQQPASREVHLLSEGLRL
jgi:hypothetical protein